MDELQSRQLIAELSAKLELLQSENIRLKGTQQSIAEVNNNYLMLHYLTRNIQDCQSTQELWETYLHNLSDCGFNYDNVAVLLPDDTDNFSIKLTLVNGKIAQVTEAAQEDYIVRAIVDKASVTTPDNLQAAVPIVSKSRGLKAVLLAEKKQGIFFEDIQLLDVYIRQTTATIENIMLNEKLRHFQELLGRQLDQFVMLHYVTKAIHDAGNYYDVLTKYLQTLCSPLGFGFREGALYILSEYEVQRASLQADRLRLDELAVLPEPLLEQVVAAKQYLLSENRCRLFMPLNCFGNVSAVIEINNDSEIMLEKIQMLEIFAMQTSSAIDNTRLKLHLEFLSFHDQLTNLYNRAYFEKEIQRIEKEKIYPAGIIVCDLDGLKMVNDNWGHDAGDQFILAAAGIIKETVPPNAVAARIGGDEFAIIVTEGSVNAAGEVGVRLKIALEQYNAALPAIPVGMSIGWAASAKPVKILEIFKQADSRMYHDKDVHGKSSREYVLQTMQQRPAAKLRAQ